MQQDIMAALLAARGVSIKHPHAGLVAYGSKRAEIRDYDTKHRGLSLIHASQEPDATWRNVIPGVHHNGVELMMFQSDLAYGAVLALAVLRDTVPLRYPDPRVDPISFVRPHIGRKAWLFAPKVVRLPEPIPWPGALAPWPVANELAQRIASQMEEYGLCLPSDTRAERSATSSTSSRSEESHS